MRKHKEIEQEPAENTEQKHFEKHEKEPIVYLPDHHLTDFAAIDFEAANAQLTSACSVGVIIVHNGEITDRFYSLLKPVPNHYDFFSTKVHGLKKEDTEHAPHFPQVWNQIAEHVEGLSFVAHGMLFDQRCLKALHEYYHMPYPDYPFYCTHEGAKKFLPDLENFKLKTVAMHFGYDLTKKHHALADAEACAVIAMNIF